MKANKLANEIKRLRAALRKIKKVEKDCIKNGCGYNDIIYQACIRVLPPTRKKYE